MPHLHDAASHGAVRIGYSMGGTYRYKSVQLTVGRGPEPPVRVRTYRRDRVSVHMCCRCAAALCEQVHMHANGHSCSSSTTTARF